MSKSLEEMLEELNQSYDIALEQGMLSPKWVFTIFNQGDHQISEADSAKEAVQELYERVMK